MSVADPKDDENPDVAKPGQWEHVDRACVVCGQDYEPTRTDQRYCSKACRDKRPRRSGRDRRDGRARYAALKQRRLVATLATWVPQGTPLLLQPGPPVVDAPTKVKRTPEHKRARDRSRLRATRRALHTPEFIAGFCAECGAGFVATSHGATRATCCSDGCSTRNQRRVARQRRRARLRSVEHEPIKLSAVAQRDGWHCHICKRKVTRATWSLDHLVPLSHGGPHTYGNVALAHHRCNSLRRDTGPAQLRLVA